MEIKNNYLLIAGIVVIVLSIIFRVYSSSSLDRINNKYTDLAKVQNENDKSYLYVEEIILSNGDFYVVGVGENLYVIKSKSNLRNIDFDGKYTRIIGESKSFNNEETIEILELYNAYNVDMEEFKISIDEFNNEFGNYYLDMDKILDDSSLGTLSKSFSSLLLDCGIALLAVYVLRIIIERKKQI